MQGQVAEPVSEAAGERCSSVSRVLGVSVFDVAWKSFSAVRGLKFLSGEGVGEPVQLTRGIRLIEDTRDR